MQILSAGHKAAGNPYDINIAVMQVRFKGILQPDAALRQSYR